MPALRFAKVRLTPASEAHLRHLLDNPQRRAAAARILNDQSRLLVQIGEKMTEEDLHRRSVERRTAMSLNHGREVQDSWEIVPAREIGPDKLRVGARNTHPAFPILDAGTRVHDILPRNGAHLIFPFNGGAPGRAGQIGAFAVEFGEGPTKAPTGVHAHQIQPRNFRRRLFDRYRRQANRRLNR